MVGLFLFNSVEAQSFRDFLNAFVQEFAKNVSVKPSLQIVATKTIEVNSASKARFGDGKTRDLVKIELPKGTTNWYYRVTVLDINSNYQYQENETLYYLFTNRKAMDIYAPTRNGIDFFILGHSGDASTFLQTGNNNFRSFQDFNKLNSNSFVGSCNVVQDNLWIGIRNPNSLTGLKVIVEVVALGLYQN